MNSYESEKADQEAYEKQKFQDSMAFIDEMLFNSDVPEEYKRRFWSLFNKIVLSNLKDEDELIFLNEFDIIKNNWIKSLPIDEYTLEIEQALDNIRLHFRSLVSRAIGKDRERILEAQQTMVHHNINTSRTMQLPKQGGMGGGVMSKINGFLGRRPKNIDPSSQVNL
jgi:hypothetical protein